jgi:hypothetical protein
MRPLADDTPLDVERRQIEGWRAMTPSEKCAIISSLSSSVLQLALLGVRQRFPEATEREQCYQLAVVMHGRDIARQAFAVSAQPPP